MSITTSSSMTAPAGGACSPARFLKQRSRVFWLLFVAYVGYYFCRITVPVALPLIRENFQLSNTETGFILSVFYATYSASKAINGFIGDRIGGKLLMLVGIGGSILCNTLFGFGGALAFFVLTWGANAFFQSMGWLGLLPIMSRWYRTRETGRAMGFLSLSYLIGDFAARSSAGLILITFAWSWLFWLHSAVLGLVGLLVWWLLKPSPENAGPPSQSADDGQGTAAPQPHSVNHSRLERPGPEPTQPQHLRPVRSVDRSEYRRWLGGMLSNRWFWLVCVVYLCLSITRYIFWGWSVEYAMQAGAGMGTAALTSAFFPLLGSLGTIFAGWMSDRSEGRGPIIAVMSTLLVGAIYLFSQVSAEHPVLLMATLGLIGFLLYGPYSLMAGAVAIDFGSRYTSSSAAGIIDSLGAIGTVATGAGMGYMIDQYGWDQAFLTVTAFAAVSAALSFTLWNLRPPGRYV